MKTQYLKHSIEIILCIVSSFQCDGCSLELANGPSLEGIAVLNIPSMYGGSNLWGDTPGNKKRKKPTKSPKKDKDRESSSSMSSVDLSFAIQGRYHFLSWVCFFE